MVHEVRCHTLYESYVCVCVCGCLCMCVLQLDVPTNVSA